jgi:hypothetical protein
MLRRVALAISYLVAIVFVLSIVLPAQYCLRTGCKGPGELDAFMPAFMLSPLGAIGTAFALSNSIRNIRGKSHLWVFWPLAIIFAIVLLGVAAMLAWIVFETAAPR